MDTRIENSIRETFDGSNEGRLHFGDVVRRLMAAGVESYAVDYRALRATYYLLHDEVLTLPLQAPDRAPAPEFDGDAVVAAIRGAQAGAVMYPEFKRRTIAAGCVGYIVWIEGRHVTYFGRKGQMHVERFPD